MPKIELDFSEDEVLYRRVWSVFLDPEHDIVRLLRLVFDQDQIKKNLVEMLRGK